MLSRTVQAILCLLICVTAFFQEAHAGIEPYEKNIKGVIKKGDTIVVKDEKFRNPSFDWSSITKQSVSNVVSFRLTYDTAVLLNKAFNAELDVDIEYYSTPEQAEPIVLNNIKLKLSYKPDTGAVIKTQDDYVFSNAYLVKVKVNSFTSQELGKKIPPVFQLTSKIIVDRKYTFQRSAALQPSAYFTGDAAANEAPAEGQMMMMSLSTGTLSNYHLALGWNAIQGAEEYDIEWATADAGTPRGLLAQQLAAGTTLTADQLNAIFRNNATRITTDRNLYDISMVYNADYLLVRMRQVAYDVNTHERIEDDWDYQLDNGSYAVWDIAGLWHEPNLNWQYTGTFAEEGKKKEVVSYFDGTLRNRQSITGNPVDNVTMVQEDIYDEFGRPTAKILPAPIAEGNLHYYRDFNKSSTGASYDFVNATGTIGVNCEIKPQALNSISGAANYYSASNTTFIGLASYNKYIPQSGGFPLSVTQYTADNTGRLRLQSGVGSFFQPGISGSRISKYYYGKPEPWELDRLFGNDVGYAHHYFKNMVIDPNGQISISYLNASGKTIATALTGTALAGVDALPSRPVVKDETFYVLRPEQFVFDASSLKLNGKTTYLASVTGTATMNYDIQQLVYSELHNGFQVCSNCYYDMTITVKNNCNQVVYETTTPLQIGSATADCNASGLQSNSFTLNFATIGEYYINFELALSKKVIEAYTDQYISQRQQHGTLKTELDYIIDYITNDNYDDCYNDCRTCAIALGTQEQFRNAVLGSLTRSEVSYSAKETEITTWANGLYDQLKANCTNLQQNCDMSPCARYEQQMLLDVSPGGQYALFTTAPSFTLIEPAINVLSNFRAEFPVKSSTDPDYIAEQFTTEDGSITSPYASSFTPEMLVKYWRGDWAYKFLKYHPEKCKLDFCNANSAYYSWDERLKAFYPKSSDLTNLVSGLQYDRNTANFLFQNDPFFQSGAPGAAYATDMLNDLTSYSSRFLNISQTPVKSLSAFVDFQLYCSNWDPVAYNLNGWGGCTIDANCRVIDREWQQYLKLYLELKEKYYLLVRSNGVCSNACQVGVPFKEVGVCAQVHDFTVSEVADDNNACPGQKKIKVTYIPIILKRNTTVTMYSSEYTGVPDTLLFASGEYEKTFCVAADAVVDAIRVESATCDPESGVQGALCSPGGNTGFLYLTQEDVIHAPNKFTDDDLQGTKTTYTIIEGQRDMPPSAAAYCTEGTPGTPVFYNCYTVSSLINGSNYRFYNVWVIPCEVVEPMMMMSTMSTGSIPPGCGDESDFNAQVISPICPGGSGSNTIYVKITPKSGVALCSGQHASITVIQVLQGGAQVPVWSGSFPVGQTEYSVCGGNSSSPTLEVYVCGKIIGDCEVVPPANSPCAPYASKKSRFFEYDRAGEIDVEKMSNETTELLFMQISENCEANADYWMRQLESCFTSLQTFQKTQLRMRLLAVCKQGGDISHPYGATTIRPGDSPMPGGYASFKAAIISVLGSSAISMACNPWLIDNPRPYTPVAQLAELSVSQTNYKLCERITQLKTDHQAEQPTTTFYDYLKTKYGDAMTLSSTQLNMLLKSCDNCRYILEEDLTIPAFMQPGSTGCITKTQWDAKKASLISEIGTSYDVNDANFEQVFSTYMNNEFGFALSYLRYKEFDANVAVNRSLTLCNEPPFSTVAVDPYACMTNKIAVNIINAKRDYAAMIIEVKKQFRAQYVNKCSQAAVNAKLTSKQQIYHYTLYYYDQAGNLMRTVPPEGVVFLTDNEMNKVSDARKFDVSSCSYTGPTANSDKTTALQHVAESLNAPGNNAIEMWLYKTDNTTHQMIASSVSGTEKSMMQLCIKNGQLAIDIYKLAQSTPADVTITSSNHILADLGAVLPLKEWIHVVVQGQSLSSGMLSVYVNGQQLPVISQLPSASCGWEIVSGSPVVMPEDITTLKQVRLYDRLMMASEIAANAREGCMGIAAALQATLIPDHWERFNTPAAGAAGTIGGGTTEAQYIPVYPNHKLPSSYVFNSTGQVVSQLTPDGGRSNFWYDELSRLVASQNEEQNAPAAAGATANRYSYTKFDILGRITEVGEKTGVAQSLPAAGFINEATITAFQADGTNNQVTQTYYDVSPPLISGIPTPSTQDNLRKRVAATVYKETAAGAASQASYYSYDLLGNVKVLQQHVEGLGFKKIEYQYDLASGKVNFVAYQHGQNDAFYYKYGYDFENRIIKASSGTTANLQFQGGSIITNEKIDAEYQYYIHGPLARVELGANKVQGIDYAYTLQGWLKGINGQRLIAGEEMGGDGVASTPRAPIARDVVAYSLGYYFNDYQPVGTNTAFPMSFSLVSGDPSGYDMYNGNISHTTVAINKFNSGVPEAFTYKYDQLNRLKQVRHHTVTNTTTTWGHSTVTTKFRESLTYDGNGNIKTDVRNGAGEGAFLVSMDQMTYQYNTAVDPVSGATYLVNNRLRHINDLVSATQYSQTNQGIQDIDDQTADNYTYDKIGNLIGDKQAALQFNASSTDPMKFEWNVYGKLKKVTKDASNYIVYKYDPAGNRTTKEVTVAGVTTKTWYVRDAQGNTLALYSDKLNTTTGNWWKEQHLYGSSRLGVWTPEVNVSSANGTSVWGTEGKTMYELTNHLGNVLATISDKKIGHNNGSGGIDYYEADVVSASNYYPFGMQMPGRTFNAAKYRFGFNDKENDDDVKGAGFQQDYGMRIYDARVGRFLSVDPISHDYPMLTPYQFASNTPLQAIDLDGLEAWKVTKQWTPEYIERYQRQVSSVMSNLKSTNKKFTCEDFALNTVINFARTNGLPFKWETGAKYFDAEDPNYKDFDSFLKEIKMRTGAPDFINKNNTQPVPISEISAGTNVIHTDIGEKRPHHVSVISGLVSDKANNLTGYKFFQGNFRGGALYDRALGSENPDSWRYHGAPVQVGYFNILSGDWINNTLNRTTPSYNSQEQMDYRNFNFSQWNIKFQYKLTQIPITTSSSTTSAPSTTNVEVYEKVGTTPRTP